MSSIPTGSPPDRAALRTCCAVHPDGSPATGEVLRFSLQRDDDFCHENVPPDEDGIVTLDLPPGPNSRVRQPRMAGHRLVGYAPRFTVPTEGPVEVVMEEADTIVIALDGQATESTIDARAAKVRIAYAGETWIHEHERPGLEPVRFKVR